MKFAHFADCHIGGWREEKLKELNMSAFVKAVNACISEKVDFILISGDLFNTSLPGIDQLKEAVKQLKKLKNSSIPVYIIAGSHDFSPSGKTMLDVLDEAGLVRNVLKGKADGNKLFLEFSIDLKTGAKITGMFGKKGMLEKAYYENLEKTNLETEEGFKIFMFHTAITELKTKEFEHIDSSPVSFLPKGFDYYAGGHVHIVKTSSIDEYKNIVYPGPLFPNSFSELEKLKKGNFVIYDEGKITNVPVQVVNVYSIEKDCTNLTPEQIDAELMKEISNKELNNTIVTLRLFGMLKSGKPSDIKLQEIIAMLYSKSAFFVMKNLNQLESKEFEEIKVQENSVDETEEKLITEHLGKNKELGIEAEQEKQLTKELMNSLSSEKEEGEKVYEFESRIREETKKVIDLLKQFS